MFERFAVISPKVKWRTQYRTGKMHYNNGYLTIGTDGVYFVYCQMYYFDGVSAYIGYEVYLDDKKILKAVHSVASKTRKYQTQYTSGIFEVSKGQKISIESPFAKYYYFNETLSYFGAFILQEKTANGN
jgi:acetyltransferase-like isoleucine patch superfamily enzyme